METLEEEEEESTTHQPTTRPWRQMSSMVVLMSALAVLVVAALIFSLVEWQSANDKLSQQRHLRDSAVKAADTYGVAFGSYDYRNLHGSTASWTVIEKNATAKFRADYQKTSGQLQPTIVAYKATASATVPVSAASSVTSSKAVVLMVLSQKITNSTQKNGPQTQQFIVVMTLLRQKGHWLIDNVQAST